MATPSKKTIINYFAKLPSKTKSVEENPRKLAPAHNKQHVENFKAKLDQFDAELDSDTKPSINYLKCIKSGEVKPFRIETKLRGTLRARLLQFSEDVRPPYFGTWQKKSKLVTGRRPFGNDKIFDYDVDSEAEWDLGGPGESLKGDDSEDDEDGLDDYEIDMKTFVPHGYISDDEINSDNDKDSSANNESKSANNESKSAKNESSSAKNESLYVEPTKQFTPKPIILGVSYEENPTISETKLEFLRNFQGIHCT